MTVLNVLMDLIFKESPGCFRRSHALSSVEMANESLISVMMEILTMQMDAALLVKSRMDGRV